MSQTQNTAPPPVAAMDRLIRYYTEKLWAWIPEVYRTEDANAVPPGTLRALLETLAREAALQRQSVDRLWEDTMIEHADEWAVPYIGSLLGTRMLSPLNPRGRRVDVAKTIAYRRRAGTPWVIEELVNDITGWHGAITEGYRSMARAHHNYDAPGEAFSHGVQSHSHFETPRSGTANLRAPIPRQTLHSAYDPYFHAADIRRPVTRCYGESGSSRGQYNLARVNLFLFRQQSLLVSDVTPYRLNAHQYLLDPSGRDVALFIETKRQHGRTAISESGVSAWSPARQDEMPARMPCSLLNQASYSPRPVDVAADPALNEMVGNRFETTASLRRDFFRIIAENRLGLGPVEFAIFLDETLDEDCPRYRLYGDSKSLDLGLETADAQSKLTSGVIGGADLSQWAVLPSLSPALLPETEVLVDPTCGRVLVKQPSSGTDRDLRAPRHHYGALCDVGATTLYRTTSTDFAVSSQAPYTTNNVHGIVIDNAALTTSLANANTPLTLTIDGNRTHFLTILDNSLTVPDLTLAAQQQTRPFLRLQPESGDTITLGAEARGPDEALPELTFDGLWLGLRPSLPASSGNDFEDEPLPTTPETWTLRLSGHFGKVCLRNVTLDPGGVLTIHPGGATHIPTVRLLVEGFVEELRLERCVAGPIEENVFPSSSTEPIDPCSVGDIAIEDSIIQAPAGTPAIRAPTATVHLTRTTLFGDVSVNRLYASEVIIDGQVTVSDTTQGCFRFSAAIAPPEMTGEDTDTEVAPVVGRFPHQFESHLYPDTLPSDLFVSKRFGDAGFGQLTEFTPLEIRRGGENTSEMGAFNRQNNAILLEDLQGKIEEFRPIQAVEQLIFMS